MSVNFAGKINQTISPTTLLRLILPLIMIIHATTRISIGGVDDFGIFLSNNGFPAGEFLAWMITTFEIIGSILLILNIQVKYCSFYFIFQLCMGIYLVHLQEGWFVVGAGRNGVEYSVLLITCFVILGWIDIIQGRNKKIAVKKGEE